MLELDVPFVCSVEVVVLLEFVDVLFIALSVEVTLLLLLLVVLPVLLSVAVVVVFGFVLTMTKFLSVFTGDMPTIWDFNVAAVDV